MINGPSAYGISLQVLAGVVRVCTHPCVFEAGCEWLTTDRDYARFNRLSWRAPF